MKNSLLSTTFSIVLAVSLLMTFAIGCDTKANISETTTVADQTGQLVTIPANPQRVVSVYPMATLITYSLGGQDKLVGIDSNSPNNEILQQIDPGITDITQVGMPWEVNIETVVSLNPDVVLGASGDVRTALENAGIPVVGIDLESPTKLLQGINLIGDCIDRESQADELVLYYSQKTGMITERTSEIPEGERITVLIPNKTGKASCTGGDSYQHYLIEGAGGINVAEEVTGRWPAASVEQIMLWDPQVIIVPPYCADTVDDILYDTTWQSIDAVANGRVYAMPEYTVAWDTPVADSILGELWIAKQLYPDLFSDIDIDTEANDFYTRFYGIGYTAASCSIIDSMENEVTIPCYATEVASLRAGITEIICALGRADKIVATEEGVHGGTGYGKFIAGVHPDLMSRGCPVAGSNINLEEMLVIDPDLILIGGYGRIHWVDEMAPLGIPVVISHFETLDNYMDDIRIVAQCVGATSEAENLISYLQTKLDDVASRVGNVSEAEKVRVLYAGHDVYHVYTAETFEQAQIEAAGGMNVATELTGWLPEVSPEQIINWDPQVIVVLNDISTEDILNDTKIADVSAVQNGRVYSLPEAGWDFSSPRALFCIEWLASLMYPERFADLNMTNEADEFYNTVFGVDYSGEPLTETEFVTDMKGRVVEIPTEPERVVSVFPYVTFMMLALGGEDMLAAVDHASAVNENLARVYPSIVGKPDVGSAFSVNLESILLADPDVVFTVTWDSNPDETQETIGVPLLCIDLNYYKEGMEFIADIIGAEDKAGEFTSYYDDKMDYIHNCISDISEADKVRVYIAGGGGALSTFGAESTWHFEIEDAGGINVAADIVGGGSQEVSMEQVLIWNPELVILDKSCPDSVADLPADSAWQSVSAVVDGNVYRAPDGFLDTWGRPHMESILSRLWLADLMYPEETDIDMTSECAEFYSTFYDIELTTGEIEAILNPE